MTQKNYSTQKIFVPIMILGLGNTVFCEAIKVDLAESEDKRKKKSFPEKEESTFKQTFKHCVFASRTF